MTMTMTMTDYDKGYAVALLALCECDDYDIADAVGHIHDGIGRRHDCDIMRLIVARTPADVVAEYREQLATTLDVGDPDWDEAIAAKALMDQAA